MLFAILCMHAKKLLALYLLTVFCGGLIFNRVLSRGQLVLSLWLRGAHVWR